MNTIFVEILLLYNRFDMYFITEMFVTPHPFQINFGPKSKAFVTHRYK